MKKLFFAFFTLSNLTFGQVFSGDQEIDKNKRIGGYIMSETDTKIVEKSWQSQLATIGKQQTTKNGITITGAKIDGISSDPLTIYSRVWKQKDRTLVFLSAVLANGDIVTNGHAKWGELEKYLLAYQNKLGLEDGVRLAENAQNEAQENHKKTVKTGDKIAEKITDNKKEKEKLLKKIEENRIELEKLLTDIETNKKEQTKALENIDTKKKAVDESKIKLGVGVK